MNVKAMNLRQNQISVHLNHCSFVNNIAVRFGGAIFLQGIVSHLVSCSFDSNAASEGGAMMAVDGAVQLDNCSFSKNRAIVMGGAVYIYGTTLMVSHSAFSRNKCKFAGAILFDGNLTTLHIVRSIFSENNYNTASFSSYGMALCVGNAKHVVVNNTLFENNIGGGMALSNTFTEIENCSFLRNNGSAVLVLAYAAETVIRSTSFVANMQHTLSFLCRNIAIQNCKFVPAAEGSGPFILVKAVDRTNLRLCGNTFMEVPTQHFLTKTTLTITKYTPLIGLTTSAAKFVPLTLYLFQTFCQLNNNKVILITKTVLENASMPMLLNVEKKINMTEESSQFASGRVHLSQEIIANCLG